MEFRNLWDKLGGNLFTVLSASGVKDGLTRQEALFVEHGNLSWNVKGAFQEESNLKKLSTEVCVRGGLRRSSFEVSVMGMERRG